MQTAAWNCRVQLPCSSDIVFWNGFFVNYGLINKLSYSVFSLSLSKYICMYISLSIALSLSLSLSLSLFRARTAHARTHSLTHTVKTKKNKYNKEIVFFRIYILFLFSAQRNISVWKLRLNLAIYVACSHQMQSFCDMYLIAKRHRKITTHKRLKCNCQ